MSSTVVEEHFARLDAQRLPIRRAASGLSADALWAPPEAGRWSIGENLQHLTRMMRLFRRFSSIALLLERPIARMRRNRPFLTHARDMFSGRSLRAPFPIRPQRPATALSSEAVMEALTKETELLENLLLSEDERILGHVWLWDPVMGSVNLVQVVDLLALHEEHHFEILRRRWPAIFRLTESDPTPLA